MSRIRGKNTKPEVALRKALHRCGYRFRVNVNGLTGSPDIVLPKWRTVLFVNGCYWHRHPNCSKATTPSSNTEFWTSKFRENVERDKRNVVDLLGQGWRVGVVWECAIGKQPSDDLLNSLESFLSGEDPALKHFE
ncbi:DNA mismatch endonuclease Vsr [Rhodobacteraceae bacterium LMO-12]|nr:DNA mismatch endonuclease Vsr [Rhodobacteraceae bacterium LMO-JJ12]